MRIVTVLRQSRPALVALATLGALLTFWPASSASEPAVQTTAKLPRLVQPDKGPSEAVPRFVPAGVGTPFDGLDQSVSGFAPSDTTVAANTASVLQAVNQHVRITNTAGGGVVQTMSLAQFFNAPAVQGEMFDPKVYFDRNALNQRFYVLALQENNTDNDDPNDDLSSIHLAVSRSSTTANLNPGNWCRYEVDGLFTGPETNGQLSHADFPGLGFGADAVVITTNQRVNDDFAVSVVRPLNKLVYADNSGACPLDPYWELPASGVLGDVGAQTLQPAQHYTNPSSFPGKANPAYLVSTRSQTISSTYRVWRVANVAPVSLVNPPVLESVNVSWATYSPPPPAPGGAGGAGIDTGDAETLQVAGVGDAITAAHTIACNTTANTPPESCLRTVRFIVGQTGGAMSVTKSELQGLVGGDNVFYHHPGIAVNDAHKVAMVFLANLPGNAHRVSSRVTTRVPGGAFGPSVPLTDGTCARGASQPGEAVRTGDYTGAQTATDGNAFWVFAEHADLVNGVCQWKTRVAQVTP